LASASGWLECQKVHLNVGAQALRPYRITVSDWKLLYNDWHLWKAGIIPMSLQELKEQAFKLSVSDRLALVNAIIQSLQDTLNPQPNRKTLINQMRGLLKTDQPPPTDAQIQAILEERRVEKYIQ
jgi:hypothetical protein